MLNFRSSKLKALAVTLGKGGINCRLTARLVKPVLCSDLLKHQFLSFQRNKKIFSLFQPLHATRNLIDHYHTLFLSPLTQMKYSWSTSLFYTFDQFTDLLQISSSSAVSFLGGGTSELLKAFKKQAHIEFTQGHNNVFYFDLYSFPINSEHSICFLSLPLSTQVTYS